MKDFIDKLFCSQKRVSWRRLAVLLLGTVLLASGLLDSEQWLYLSLAYIAGDSAEKAMSAISKKQSMAIKTTKFSNQITSKILHDANMDNTVQKNIADGSGKLHSVKIANTNDAEVFIKLVNDFTASLGSTPPDWVFSCPASSTYTYEIPGGVDFDALTVFATENATPSDTITPSVSGNETIAVTIITSS